MSKRLGFAFVLCIAPIIASGQANPRRADQPNPAVRAERADRAVRPGRQARADILGDDAPRINDAISTANALDRARILTAIAYYSAGDAEKAIATLDALIAETTDGALRSLCQLLKGRALVGTGNAQAAIDALATVSGDYQPQALRSLIIALSDNALFADALAKLSDAFKASTIDLDKARILNAIFLLAQRAKDEQPQFQLECYALIAGLVDRPTADRLKTIHNDWQNAENRRIEAEKAKRQADAALMLPDLLVSIERRIERIEAAMRDQGGNPRDRREMDGPPELNERAAEMAEAMRQRFEDRVREMEAEAQKLRAAGNEEGANEIQKNIDRMRERMERGRDMMMRAGGRGGRGERENQDQAVERQNPDNPPPVNVRGDDF